MDLSEYVKRISNLAQNARSESKLEGEFNQILKECLRQFGISFNPHINESLKSLGLSQIDADRPDGVFGHIVYDYKKPGSLSTAAGTRQAKSQIERYLDTITGGHVEEFVVRDSITEAIHTTKSCTEWFGYVTDGRSLVYCRSDGLTWQWSHHHTFSEKSLLLLIHAYRSLKRKPLTPHLLSEAFGRKSKVAHKLIAVMCSLLSHPRHRTNMLFREWKRLFEQVSTYNLDQLPSLKKWASENEVATREASHILFAMHSYYNLIVKIFLITLESKLHLV